MTKFVQNLDGGYTNIALVSQIRRRDDGNYYAYIPTSNKDEALIGRIPGGCLDTILKANAHVIPHTNPKITAWVALVDDGKVSWDERPLVGWVVEDGDYPTPLLYPDNSLCVSEVLFIKIGDLYILDHHGDTHSIDVAEEWAIERVQLESRTSK